MNKKIIIAAMLLSCSAYAAETVDVNFTGNVTSACKFSNASQNTVDFGTIETSKIGVADLKLNILCTAMTYAYVYPASDTTNYSGDGELFFRIHNPSNGEMNIGSQVTFNKPYDLAFSDGFDYKDVNLKVVVSGSGEDFYANGKIVGQKLQVPQTFSTVVPIVLEY